MKIHYINILLFALPLNILENIHKKPSITHHTPKIPNTRLLCECELYGPLNYDNDPQMKKVMEIFNKQTQQRFHEYDEHMKKKRQECKDRCDKEIQKIILKDKLEKQMAQQLTTLETKIDSDDIPTCICEKSLAEKAEKTCLKCGSVFGGIAPSVSILGGIGQVALNAWKDAAIISATKEAVTEATALATQEGMKAVISKINELIAAYKGDFVVDLPRIVTPSTFDNGTALVQTADKLFGKACIIPATRGTRGFCNTAIYIKESEYYVGKFGKIGSDAYDAAFTSKKGALETANLATVDAKYAFWQTANIAPIIAIVVIVLIMVIIYLILRYRRKKKMKKKLQYIKLLEE
ncbi:rifin PIR protein, putative [Plasmodium reichenowi]|uniref:Rifin PIR protein, putative n=1 Tax=Plasmodium reichenowi TaxID=5854 RepID=A0A2P9DT62_PLARE|nr:rifin PIR protein, putative [Plasmodium reichenowi]